MQDVFFHAMYIVVLKCIQYWWSTCTLVYDVYLMSIIIMTSFMAQIIYVVNKLSPIYYHGLCNRVT